MVAMRLPGGQSRQHENSDRSPYPGRFRARKYLAHLHGIRHLRSSERQRRSQARAGFDLALPAWV